MLQLYIKEAHPSFVAPMNRVSVPFQDLEELLHRLISELCYCKSNIQGSSVLGFTLITVQFEYAPEDHGFGLKSRLGIPLGTLLPGMYDMAVHTRTISGTP